MAAERELAQAIGRADTVGHSDREALVSVVVDPAGRHLARHMCWVFTIESLETYILVPREPADLDLLIEAVRPAPANGDVDVVIGRRGPVASPEMCNGLLVPIVLFDQLYSFDRDELIQQIPRSKGQYKAKFRDRWLTTPARSTNTVPSIIWRYATRPFTSGPSRPMPPSPRSPELSSVRRARVDPEPSWT